jgi:hypothetical protein
MLWSGLHHETIEAAHSSADWAISLSQHRTPLPGHLRPHHRHPLDVRRPRRPRRLLPGHRRTPPATPHVPLSLCKTKEVAAVNERNRGCALPLLALPSDFLILPFSTPAPYWSGCLLVRAIHCRRRQQRGRGDAFDFGSAREHAGENPGQMDRTELTGHTCHPRCSMSRLSTPWRAWPPRSQGRWCWCWGWPLHSPVPGGPDAFRPCWCRFYAGGRQVWPAAAVTSWAVISPSPLISVVLMLSFDFLIVTWKWYGGNPI